MGSDLQTGTASRQSQQSTGWAPWWIYVLVIAPANVGGQQLLAEDAAGWLRAALTAAIVVAGVAVVTLIYRASRDVRRA